MFICNIRDRVEATGWESGNYSNQYWAGRFNDAYSMTNAAWGASVDPLYRLLTVDFC